MWNCWKIVGLGQTKGSEAAEPWGSGLTSSLRCAATSTYLLQGVLGTCTVDNSWVWWIMRGWQAIYGWEIHPTFGNAILQALCGWRKFRNRGNTENNGRKEHLKICVSADGRDLLLLRTDAAEKTVECGSKARGSVPRRKSRSLNSGAVFSAG